MNSTREKCNAAPAWLHAIVLAVLVLMAACYATVVRLPFDRAARAVAFPYQLDGEEGFLLAQAQRLATGEGLYGSLTQPPYVVDNYPPLYPAVWSLWVRANGGGAAAPSLAPGRLLAAASAVVAALLVAWLVAGGALSGRGAERQAGGLRHNAGARAQGGEAWFDRSLAFLLAWCCAAQFLTEYGVVRWLAYARVDLPAVALTLAGFALFFFAGRRTSARGAWVRGGAALLMALALLTKQTAIAAPAACFLWLLAGRRWRDAAWWAASVALAVGLPTLLLAAATHGGYWRHTVTYNRNVMRWHELAWWARHVWLFYGPLLLASAVLGVRVAVGAVRTHRGKVGQASRLSREASAPTNGSAVHSDCPPEPSAPLGLLAIYAALNAISLVSLAKAGSAENYFIEPAAAVIAFTGAACGRLLLGAGASGDRSPQAGGSKARGRAADRLDLAVALVALALFLAQAVHYTAAGPREPGRAIAHNARLAAGSAASPTVEALVAGDRTVRWLRGLPAGPVLCEDPICALRAGRPVHFQNFIMTQLAAESKWDETPLAEAVAAGRIAGIESHQDLLHEQPGEFFDRWSPALRAAIRQSYRLAAQSPTSAPGVQATFLYEPAASAASARR